MKNNNPGNIEKSNQKVWQGEIFPGNDARFVTFETPAFGYRALYKVLLTYIGNGYNTLDKIIGRYAPASDGNPVYVYVSFVSDMSGVARDYVLTTNDVDYIYAVGFNMARFETGMLPVKAEIETGFKMAYGDAVSPEVSTGLYWLAAVAVIALLYKS